MGRAYGNIGNAYSAAGFYEQAIKYHKHELIISKEVHDRSAEASTHGKHNIQFFSEFHSYKFCVCFFRVFSSNF
jgi:hypothetical protein